MEIEGAKKIFMEKIDAASKVSGTQGFYTNAMIAFMEMAGVSADKSFESDYWNHIKAQDPDTIEYIIAKEIHKYDYHNDEGFSALFSGLMAFAVGLCTGGLGWGVAAINGVTGVTLTGAYAVAANAAAAAFCGKVVSDTLYNITDPSKALKEICSYKTLKTMGKAALTAGITHGVLDKLDMLPPPVENPVTYVNADAAARALEDAATAAAGNTTTVASVMSDIVTRLPEQSVRSLVSSTVRSCFGDSHAFSNILEQTAASAVGAATASAVGNLRDDGKLDDVTHKLAHGVVGGVTGAILEDNRDGITAGALSGMISESVAEYTYNKTSDVDFSAKVGKITGAVLGALAREKLDASTFAASNAVDHNFVVHVRRQEDILRLQQQVSHLREAERLEKARVEAEKRAEAERLKQNTRNVTKQEELSSQKKSIFWESIDLQRAREYIAKGTPLTPRSKAALSAVRFFDALERTPEGREYIQNANLTREKLSQNAYDIIEDGVIFNAQKKIIVKEDITPYEQKVLDESQKGWNAFTGWVSEHMPDSVQKCADGLTQWVSDKNLPERFEKSELYWKEYQAGQKEFSIKHTFRHGLLNILTTAETISVGLESSSRAVARSGGVDKELATNGTKIFAAARASAAGIKSLFVTTQKISQKVATKNTAKVAKAEMTEAVHVVKAPANSNFPAPKAAANGPKQVKQPLSATGTDGVPANPNFTQGHAFSNITGNSTSFESRLSRGTGHGDVPVAKKGPVVETPSTRPEVNHVRADRLPPAAQSKAPQVTKSVEGVGLQSNNQRPYNPREMESHLRGRYGSENVTSSTLPAMSKPNVKLSGKELDLGNGIKIPFDHRGFPIFDKYARFETKIADSIWQQKNRTLHFKEATLHLKEAIEMGSLPRSQFCAEQLQAIVQCQPKIPGYTWHHDLQKIQLVPEAIHNHPSMRHVGGFSMGSK